MWQINHCHVYDSAIRLILLVKQYRHVQTELFGYHRLQSFSYCIIHCDPPLYVAPYFICSADPGGRVNFVFKHLRVAELCFA
jgi:hypothetical protein